MSKLTAKNLRRLREAAGLSQNDLAAICGVSGSAISQFESGSKAPSFEVTIKICESLSCSITELADREEIQGFGFTIYEQKIIEKYRTIDEIGKRAVNAVLDVEAERNSAVIEVKKSRIIPLFPAAAGAGEPVDGAAFDSWEVPEDSKAQFAVRISGDSMEPELHDGEVVLCERRRPQIGELAVIMVNGFLLVKQYIADNFGNIYLRSINRERKDLDYDILASGNDTAVGYGTVIHDKVELVKQ